MQHTKQTGSEKKFPEHIVIKILSIKKKNKTKINNNQKRILKATRGKANKGRHKRITSDF